MFPPVFALFVFIGDGVDIGVEVVFMVVLVVELVVLMLPALFVFSLAQPIPRAMTASKVRRAKILRIELSPADPPGQTVKEPLPKRLSISAGTLLASTPPMV